MRAILLAAGLGTRLRPLTNTVPKCLVPIKGEPLLGYWLDSLANTGITSILINLHHHADQVERFIEKRSDQKNITLIFEKELRGTGGTVRENAGFCNNEPVMVIHADNFCTSDLSKFIRAHGDRPSSTEITMMTFRADIPEDCGIVEVNDHGVVFAFHEKVKNPPGNIANGAVYIFEPEVVRFICSESGNPISDISNDLLPRYLQRIFTWPTDGLHIDVGTLANLEKARQFSKK